MRLLAALSAGVAIAGTAFIGAYCEMGGAPNYRRGEWFTRHELDDLREAVERHRQATGRLPANLADLKEVKGRDRYKHHADGGPLDAWDRPHQYRVDGDGFALFSFGRDGLRDGVGLDADIYPTLAGRPQEMPTLRQFAFELPTDGIRFTCIMAGVCGGLICLIQSRRRGGFELLAFAGATMVGAVLVAVFISFLHIPSGH